MLVWDLGYGMCWVGSGDGCISLWYFFEIFIIGYVYGRVFGFFFFWVNCMLSGRVVKGGFEIVIFFLGFFGISWRLNSFYVGKDKIFFDINCFCFVVD